MVQSPQLRLRREDGFTLVEVIVVLAVVLLLTGIAIPLVGGYIEDGRRARAESEAKTLGSAVMRFYKDVGVWPARNSSAVNNQVNLMVTGATLPATNPWSAPHTFATWAMSSTLGDTLDNQLLYNRPQGAAAGAYLTTGNMRWRGPYLAGGAPMDPWGRPYVMNVIGGHSIDPINDRRVFMLSAGPNGVFDTDATATATTDIGGDDIGLILNQR